MKNTKPDFNGQVLFIGIDVHLKNWVIAVICNQILIKKISIDPKVEEILSFLRRHYPGAEFYSAYEAGFSGYWIHRELLAAGIINIVVNAADIPTTDKQKSRKTDKVDAVKIARELSKGSLTPLYVPTEEQDAFRIMVRRRFQLVKDKTRVMNQIKSLLYYNGIKLPEKNEMTHWSNLFIKYISELPIKNEFTRIALDQMLEQLRHDRQELASLLKKIRKSVKQNPRASKIVALLDSVPGVGFILAVVIYSELMDIRRFKRFDYLNSYVGLAPDSHSSGETERISGLTRRQKIILRSMLIEASWVALRKDEALSAKYSKLLSRGKGPQKAIIMIARKLLSRIMHVWQKEENYVLSVVE
jgi:transposase